MGLPIVHAFFQRGSEQIEARRAQIETRFVAIAKMR